MKAEEMRQAIEVAGYLTGTVEDKQDQVFSADGLDVVWEAAEATDDVMIWCAVGGMPEKTTSEFTKFLLEANCFGSRTAGGHLGLYEPTKTLVFSYRFVPDVDARMTAKVLQAFVEKALQFTEEIQELESSADGDMEVPEENPTDGTFLRI